MVQSDPKSISKRYIDFLKSEEDSTYLYEKLAEAEKDDRLAEIYRRLALTERRHASVWRDKLQEMGVSIEASRPSWKAHVLSWLARRFGPGAVMPILVGMEHQAVSEYDDQPVAIASGMPMEERSHARVFRYLSVGGKGISGGTMASIEGRHKGVGGNALRAAVLGANDGLVSNLSLVMGVAGAAFTSSAVLTAGLAGLLAGALSMAIGEWISVKSAREMFANQIRIESAEIAEVPQEEQEELALIYQAKGMSEKDAQALAEELLRDPQQALDTLAREELGIDPDELGGSPWEASIASFLLFAAGAVIPVLPFMFLSGMIAVILSAVLSLLALFLVGALITVFTGQSAVLSGLRQLAFGLAAASVTFGLGRLLGIGLAG